jgi:formimidoylglutamate deiminase
VNRFFAHWALLPEGWARDVRLDVDAEGTLSALVPSSPPDGTTLLAGPVVAGMPNAHSHVVQRALAGRTERAGPQGDSFWTWRAAMYDFVERLDPDAFEALAADAYAEMLEAGYTSVAEFHYLHHGPGGLPYHRPSEMSERVIRAARAAGIALTLLPALYRYSGAGGVPAGEHQRRFLHSRDSFVTLWLTLAARLAGERDVRLGVSFHSLRAVEPEDIVAVLEILEARAPQPGFPLHVHVSEQTREVDAVRAFYAATPIELLARTVALDERWTLIHATHATEAELATIARAGANVAICPTTEANLGDGIFPLAAFRALGGRIAIGSDSNVTLDVSEELRWLEYVQRLATQRRSVLATPGTASLGDALFANVASCGAAAVGRSAGALEAGRRADLVVLRPDESDAADEPPSLDRYLFKSGAWRPSDVFVGGRQVVRDGRHVARELLRQNAGRARRALATS